MNKFTLCALAMVATFGLAACGSESDDGADFEAAGDNAAEMMDEAGDAAEETWEEATGQDEGVMGELQEGAEKPVKRSKKPLTKLAMPWTKPWTP